jgi:PII-like signaling protein
MVAKKPWALVIRIKKNDKVGGKPLEKVLIDFLVQSGISGATVWTGVDGFGKRGKSTVHLEGLAINMPMMIEVVDEKSKLEPLLAQIKKMVDDCGLVTVHEVNLL